MPDPAQVEAALAALMQDAGPPRTSERQAVNVQAVITEDGRKHYEVHPPDIDLQAVAAHPEEYRLYRSAVHRFEAPPDYVPPTAEGGQPL